MKTQNKHVGKREADLKKLEYYDLGGSYLFTYIDTDFPHARDVDDYGSGRMPMEALYKANIVFGKMGDGINQTIVPISMNFNPFELKNKDMFRGIIDNGEKPIPQGTDGIYISKDFGDTGAESDSYLGYSLKDGVGIRMPSSSQMNDEKRQLCNQYVALINTLKKNRVLEAFENPPHNMTHLQEEEMTATVNDLTQWLVDQSIIKMQDALEEEKETSKNLSKEDSQEFTHMSFETAIEAVASSTEGQMKMFETSIALQKQNLIAESDACRRFQESADARGIDMHGVTKEDLDWFVRGYHALAYYQKNAKDLLPIVEEYTGFKGKKAVEKYMDEFLPHIDKKFDSGMDFSKVEAAVRNIRARAVATPEVKAHMATRAADIKIQLDYIERVERMIKTKEDVLSSYFSISNGDMDFLKGSTRMDYEALLKNIDRLENNMKATRELISQTEDADKRIELENKLAQRAEVMEVLTSLKEIHPENNDIKLSRGGLSTINIVAQKDRRMFTAKENAVIDEFNARVENGDLKISSFDDVLKLSTTELGQELKPIVENYRVKYFKDGIDEDAKLDGPTIERLKSAGAFSTYEFDPAAHRIVSKNLLQKHADEIGKDASLTPKEINERATRRCFEEISDPQQLAIRIQQMRRAMRELRADKGTEFDFYSDPEYQKMTSTLNVLQDAYSRWEKSHMLSEKMITDKDALREDIRKQINENEDVKSVRTEPSARLLEGIDKLKNYTDEEKKDIKEILQSEFTRYNVPQDGQDILFDKIKNMDDHSRTIDPREANIWKALCVACSEKNLERLGGTMSDNITVKDVVRSSEYSFMAIAAANPNMDVDTLADLQLKMKGLYETAQDAATNKERSLIGVISNRFTPVSEERKEALESILGVDVHQSWKDKVFGDETIRDTLEDRTQTYETKLSEVLQYATRDQIQQIVGELGENGKLCSYDELVRIADEQIQSGQKNYLLEIRGQASKDEDIKALIDIASKKIEDVPNFSFRDTRLGEIKNEAMSFLDNEMTQAIIEKDAARQAVIADAKEQIKEIVAAQEMAPVLTNSEADAIKGNILNVQELKEISAADIKEAEEAESPDYKIVQDIRDALGKDMNDYSAVRIFNESMRRFVQNEGKDSAINPGVYMDIGLHAYTTKYDITGDITNYLEGMTISDIDTTSKEAMYLLDYYNSLEEAEIPTVTEALQTSKERVEQNLLKLNPEEAQRRGITEKTSETEKTAEVKEESSQQPTPKNQDAGIDR